MRGMVNPMMGTMRSMVEGPLARGLDGAATPQGIPNIHPIARR
jgi:hypothetical protein